MLLATPFATPILKSLHHGARERAELLQRTTSRDSALRVPLERLTARAAIWRRQRREFPRAIHYELAPPGQDLLPIVESVERWLAGAPDAPVRLGGDSAATAVAALAEGWSTLVLHALAAGPLSLADLDRAIDSLSYPALERRLATLRLAGQVEATEPAKGRKTPYALTDWAHKGIDLFLAAARWERMHDC